MRFKVGDRICFRQFAYDTGTVIKLIRKANASYSKIYYMVKWDNIAIAGKDDGLYISDALTLSINHNDVLKSML